MALPDTIEGEDVIITFEKEWKTGDTQTTSTAIQNVDGKVLSWNLSGGAQNTEDVFAFGGKTFNYSKAREKFTFTAEVMINSADFDFVQFGSSISGARYGSITQKTIKSTDATSRWRIGMWFQDSAYHKTNSAKTITVPGKANTLYYMLFVDCKAVTFDKEFTADEYMKGTLTFEFSASDENGFANYISEEGIFAGTTSTKLHPITDATTTGLMLEARGSLSWNTTTPAWTAGTTTNRYRYTG